MTVDRTPLTDMVTALEAIVGPEHVAAPETALPEGVDGRLPRAVVFPKDPEEIGAILRYANEKRLAVIPVGGGTQLGLGHPPERVDIALSLSRLDQIVAHEPADMTVTVQAGISIAALQAHLARHGQCLPYDPPLPGRATIGGIIATREAGPLRQAFRGVADRLLGVQVVTASGKIAKAGGRVVKNVSGYEMGRLYTGSLGTLAVIVEATFKVQPSFPEAGMIAVSLASVEAAHPVIRALLDSDAEPVLLELLGPVAAGVASPQELLSRFSQHARAFANLEAADLRGSQSGALLVAGYAGTREETEWQLAEAERLITPHLDKGAAMERIPWALGHQAVLQAHRRDAQSVIPLAASASPDATSARAQEREETSPTDDSITCRAHVRASELVRVVFQARALAAGSGLALAYAAHAGTGIVRFHVPAGDEERALRLISSLREESAGAGGFLIVERAAPSLKANVPVFGPLGKEFFLHKAIKERMDPNRILNPGRFLGNL
ncbi:MAG TPA: FAD-binding oxidoreductase [Limnochordia bacterium]|nr:FAD-binding oxidoreductase [Limnochordia bacterium]